MLKDMGYERVELIDTTDGSFMTPKEARHLMLLGSTLLVGRKLGGIDTSNAGLHPRLARHRTKALGRSDNRCDFCMKVM